MTYETDPFPVETVRVSSVPRIDPTANGGIYRITCTVTGKVYVGSALNLRKRFRQHISSLKIGKHFNAYLQRAWDKHGEAAFAFEIIETVAPECLLDAEQRHIDSHDAANPEKGFNGRPHAASNLGKRWPAEVRARMGAPRGTRHSAEHRAKLSALVRARGPEYHARLSAARIGNKNSLGRKQPPEVLAKISAASIRMWAARRAKQAVA